MAGSSSTTRILTGFGMWQLGFEHRQLQAERDALPVRTAFFQFQAAAMSVRDLPGDIQAEAGARCAAPRACASIETLEDVVALTGLDETALVVHTDISYSIL